MEIGAQDITLACKDCLEQFLFTVAEQNFFTKKDFPIPKRCKQCRVARKRERANTNKDLNRQMNEIICAQCGKVAYVPFKPIKGRPVYCKSCYQSVFTSKQKSSQKVHSK